MFIIQGKRQYIKYPCKETYKIVIFYIHQFIINLRIYIKLYWLFNRYVFIFVTLAVFVT
jgi:hypothetical protein